MRMPLPPYVELTLDQIEALTDLVFGPMVTPRPTDACFVFGGTHPGLWQTAIGLFRKGLVGHFIVTGRDDGSPAPGRHPSWHHPPGTPESHVMAAHLREAGVRDESITVEDRSTNSLENVLLARELFDFGRVRSLISVSKSYGAGRQFRTLRAHIPSQVVIYPVSFDADNPGLGLGPVRRDTWFASRTAVRLILSAYERIMTYGSRGDLVRAEPIPGVPLTRCATPS